MNLYETLAKINHRRGAWSTIKKFPGGSRGTLNRDKRPPHYLKKGGGKKWKKRERSTISPTSW